VYRAATELDAEYLRGDELSVVVDETAAEDAFVDAVREALRRGQHPGRG
jgi:hypothetical protein